MKRGHRRKYNTYARQHLTNLSVVSNERQWLAEKVKFICHRLPPFAFHIFSFVGLCWHNINDSSQKLKTKPVSWSHKRQTTNSSTAREERNGMFKWVIFNVMQKVRIAGKLWSVHEIRNDGQRQEMRLNIMRQIVERDFVQFSYHVQEIRIH